MAITEVQHVQNHNASATSLATGITATTAGNAVVVAATAYGTSGQSITSVKLGATSLTSGVSAASDANAVCSIWYLLNNAGGGTTVTINVSSAATGTQIQCNVYEFSGVVLASGVDQTSTGTAASSAAWSSNTTGTTLVANEVAVGCVMGYNNGTSFTTTGPGGSWVNGTTITNSLSSLFTRTLAGYELLTSPATATYSGTTSTVATSSAAVLTLKGPGPAVSLATVTIATPAPGVKVSPAPSPATVTISTPAPTVQIGFNVAVNVATVTVATPAPGVKFPATVTPGVAAVTIATPAPTLPRTLAPGVATVAIATPRPTVTLGPAVHQATVTVATPAPTVHLGVSVAVSPATVVVAAQPVTAAANRNLLVSVASQAGTDDYGNAFPAGFFTSVGIILLYNGTPGLGTLFYSNSPNGGTDAYGNVYPQGEAYYGISGLTSTFTVEDTSGNTLAGINSLGNITGQTLSAGVDVIIAGESFLSGYLPPLSEGVLYRTNVFYQQSRPFPSTPTTSEVVLYELDVALAGGRDYTFHIAPILVNLGGPGQAILTIYYTSDGSTPTTSSNVWATNIAQVAGSNATLPTTVQLHMEYSPTASHTYRFIVSLQTSGTGSGTPTWQVPASSAIGVNMGAMWVFDGGVISPDTGLWIGSGSSGGGGGSPQTFTKTYTALHTYAYEGTNADSNPNPGFTPGALINQGGKAYQGDDQLGDNGNTSTMIVWPNQVQTDLASASSVNWITLTLSNNHTWFSSGMTIHVGKHNGSAGGSTRPTYSDPDLVQHSVSEGATITFSLSGALTAFANALETGQPFVLYNPSSNRNSYGYFSGGAQSSPPQVTVNYTT